MNSKSDDLNELVKQDKYRYHENLPEQYRNDLEVITLCKCQYKNVQKRENKNVQFPGSFLSGIILQKGPNSLCSV